MTTQKLRLTAVIFLVVSLLLLSACSKNNSGANSSPSESAASESAGSESAAASEETGGVSKDGFPFVSEPITIQGFAGKHGVQVDWNEMPIFAELEKKTNVKIQWENVDEQAFLEKMNLKFASNELPDIVARAFMSSSDIVKYGSQGMIIDLKPMIDAGYAPNLKKIFDADPSIEKAMTTADGKIYTLPIISQGTIFRSHILWLNKAYLDKMGLPMPKTLDEFANALIAFKEKNPTGNENAVAISDFTNNMSRYLTSFGGMFGIANKGNVFAGDGVDLGPDGKMRFFKTDPLYKEELQFFNKLYKAGVFDPATFTHAPPDWIAKVGSGEVFSFIQSDVSFAKDAAKDYVPVPLTGPHGNEWTNIGPAVNNNVGFITKNSKNPEAALRWFDYFYSEEGSVLYQFGIPDQTFKLGADGTYESLLKPEEAGQISPNYGAGLPFQYLKDEFKVHPPKNMGALQIALDGFDVMEPSITKNDVNPFAFTDEENQAMQQFKTEVLAAANGNSTGYISEMETKFIMGKESFDKWDEYVKKVQDLGLDDYMKIYNDALERYNNQ